jgi:LuxR family maltose regulon positive regulatory protein
MLQEAENRLIAENEPLDFAELRNYLVQLRAYIANVQGDADLAIQVALDAERQSKQANTSVVDVNYLIGFQLGYAYYSKGDLETAEKIFQSVAKSAELTEDIYNTIIAQVELAGIQLLRGNLLQAEEIYNNAQQWLDWKVQNPAILEGILKVCQASILLERNELRKASRLVREGLDEALLGFRSNTVAYGYVVLANILRAQGDLPQARQAVEKATIQIQQRRAYPRTVKNVKTCQVDQWLAEGDLCAAQKWAREEFQASYDPVPFSQESEHIALARVLLASKQFVEALDLLEKMAKAAELGRREGRLIKINILRALALSGLGQIGKALKVLEKSLLKAEPEGYFRSFLDEGAQLENLLRSGKQEGTWKMPALSHYVDRLLSSSGG